EVARVDSLPYARLPQEIIKEQGGVWGERLPAEVCHAGVSLQQTEEQLFDVLLEVKQMKRLPVVDFAAGGIATPADAALMMTLGNDGVFVGSGIFKSDDPKARAKAVVEATTHWDDPKVIAEVSKGIGAAMKGIANASIPAEQQLATRGW